MNWFLKVLENYANFKGRARRKEYWMFTLYSALISLTLMLLDYINFDVNPLQGGVLRTVFAWGTFLPGMAVGARRLHDLGKSAWYLLIPFIPIAGPIWFIVLMATDGQAGENYYGIDPKGKSTGYANAEDGILDNSLLA